MKLAIFPFLVLTSILVSTTTHVQSIDLVSDRSTSWRLAVETNNLRNWTVIPPEFVNYVKDYMTNTSLGVTPYEIDIYQFSGSIGDLFTSGEVVTVGNNDVFIFDLSDTLLSNLPYYQRPDVNYGSKPFNRSSFLEWVIQGEAPAVPWMTKIYNLLLRIGYKAVIISGSSESLRGVLEDNLKKVGYDNWFRFYLKDEAVTTKEFKIKVRTRLVEEEGYNIVGNVGDQWRDLTGAHVGHTFKVPNPMYYLG